MSLAQIISGYVFNSTRALTELATSNPERHGRRALSLVSIKNEAAATELKGVNLSLTAAYRDRNDAVKAHRFEIDYVRHHANYVPKTPEAARAHAKNIDTYDFEVAPARQAVEYLEHRRDRLSADTRKYDAAIQLIRDALGDRGVRNVEWQHTTTPF